MGKKIIRIITLIPQRVLGVYLFIEILSQLFTDKPIESLPRMLLGTMVVSFGIQAVTYLSTKDEELIKRLQGTGIDLYSWMIVSGLVIDLILSVSSFVF